MAIRYETGSTYFPGYQTAESIVEFLEPLEVAKRALRDRRELTLLEVESIQKVVEFLAINTVKPDQWIRNAVMTIERFSNEILGGDLTAGLKKGQEDSFEAEMMMQRYLDLHRDLTPVQIASLVLGPKLWFSLNGVNIDWKNNIKAEGRAHIANSKNGNFNPAVRLFLLFLCGTGFEYSHLKTLKLKDFGRIGTNGKLVPNLASSPLVIEFEQDGERKITFLGEEAREAMVNYIVENQLKSEDFLFGTPEEFQKLQDIAEKRGRMIIDSVNEVNVTLCSTVGNFFKEWGIPGRNFFKENNLPDPFEKK